jgi:hypothetical protein
MEVLRKECDLLPVNVALPKEIVADSNGKPRSWVKNFFNKNQATIRSNKDFGNSQDAKSLAAHFNSMPALKFLELFKEGGDLHKFFSDGKGVNTGEFNNLVSHMTKLRNGLEGMANKLSSYEGNSFKDFEVSKQFAPPESNQKIDGNGDLVSIGKILKNHSLPDGVIKFQKLVNDTKINIRSENQYNQTVEQLELDLIQKKEVQDDEDMESQRAEDDDDLSEAGGADEDFKLDIQENEVGERNSGQGGLEQFMQRDSFSNRRAQQLEQMVQNPPVAQSQSQVPQNKNPNTTSIAQNVQAQAQVIGQAPSNTTTIQNQPPEASDSISIQQREGQISELENKKWTEALLKLGPKPTVQDYLSSQGFQFMITDGDGDCYYNSIRRTTNEDQVQETRQKIDVSVKHFLSNIPEEQRSIYDELQKRSESGYIKQNATGPNDQNAYGDIGECPAVARLYDRPVVVLSRSLPNSDEIALKRRPIVFYPDGRQTDMTADMKIPHNAIVLVHSGGLHWDGAVPVK